MPPVLTTSADRAGSFSTRRSSCVRAAAGSPVCRITASWRAMRSRGEMTSTVGEPVSTVSTGGNMPAAVPKPSARKASATAVSSAFSTPERCRDCWLRSCACSVRKSANSCSIAPVREDCAAGLSASRAMLRRAISRWRWTAAKYWRMADGLAAARGSHLPGKLRSSQPTMLNRYGATARSKSVGR